MNEPNDQRGKQCRERAAGRGKVPFMLVNFVYQLITFGARFIARSCASRCFASVFYGTWGREPNGADGLGTERSAKENFQRWKNASRDSMGIYRLSRAGKFSFFIFRETVARDVLV